MPSEFPYDVFLSHSAKDKAVVRAVAEWLRKDGLKVWFDEWVLKPGDRIPAKIEEGLERSQFTFHRSAFILQPFLDAPIKGSLAQFLYINWLPANREQEYAKGHHDAKLDTDVLNRFATWMETHAQRTGHYSEKQEKEPVKFRERLSTSIAPPTILGSPVR